LGGRARPRTKDESPAAAFNRRVIVSPDLVSTDKDRLRSKATTDLQRMKLDAVRRCFLNLYGE
jgi:hypothetical protein